MFLRGVLAPIPTPFDRNGQLDEARMRDMCARLAATPLVGLVVLGTTGEAVLLDEDESDRAIAAARSAWPRDRAFIVGTGRESTTATIHAVRRAAALGADAVLVRTPGFYKAQMNTEVFVRHYTAVADASPVPVLLYNFTAVTGVNIPVEAVARLSEHADIVGIKESGGDVAQIAGFVKRTPDDFHVLAGSSATFHAALQAGAEGGILALSCLLPEACHRLFRLSVHGEEAEARSLQEQLLPIAKLAGSMHGIAGLKAAMKLAGYDVGDPRSPLVPVSDAVVATLRDALATLKETAVV
ncbi:MAG TPA: dihydrodipicolinate synthase family protein [Vicinamibacterales bacterium]|nr:dihydrodipicolinate synthase family protein [Vicinamibacterales bacterium]